jgi:hypothetical protein
MFQHCHRYCYLHFLIGPVYYILHFTDTWRRSGPPSRIWLPTRLFFLKRYPWFVGLYKIIWNLSLANQLTGSFYVTCELFAQMICARCSSCGQQSIRVGVQQFWLTDDVRRCACCAWWRWPSGARPHRDRSSSQRLPRYCINHLPLSGFFFVSETVAIIIWSLPSCHDAVCTSYEKDLDFPPKDIFISVVPVLRVRFLFKENVWQPERKYAIVARLRSRQEWLLEYIWSSHQQD